MSVTVFLKRLTEILGTPEDQQRLIFQGRQLEDQSLLSACGVKHEDSIQLILRLKGWYPPGTGDGGMGDRRGRNPTSRFPVQVKSAAEATDTREMGAQVHVYRPKGENRIIDLRVAVEPLKSITVLQLKEKIKTVFRISGSEDVQLIFRTQMLEKDALLSDYGIRHMSTIHTVLKVPGGGGPGMGDGGMGDREGRNQSSERLADYLKMHVC